MQFLRQFGPTQGLDSTPSPSQGVPPYSGAGVSQYRFLLVYPPGPQMALHNDHSFQLPHPPHIAVSSQQIQNLCLFTLYGMFKTDASLAFSIS